MANQKHTLFHDVVKNLTRMGRTVIAEPARVPKHIEKKIVLSFIKYNLYPTLDREDLKHDPHIAYWEVDEPETHTVKLPSTIQNDKILEEATKRWISYPPQNRETIIDGEGNTVAYTMRSHAPFVAELSNVIMYGPYGLVKTKRGELPLEVKANDILHVHKVLFRTLQTWGRVKTFQILFSRVNTEKPDLQTVVSMLNMRPPPNTMAYGHWLLEVLPKLRGVKHYIDQTGREPTILIDPHAADWQKDTLRLMGIRQEQIQVWDGGPITARRLIMPRWGKNEYCRSDFEWVKSRLEDAVDHEQYEGIFPEHVYLSRENMNRRRVTNREELINMLSKYGFKSVCPEKLSFEEQVALFKNVSTIIGPNGSAYGNLIFSDCPTVIQMYPPNYFKYRLFEVASILGCDCRPLLGKQVVNGSGHNADFVAPINDVEEIISTLVQ